MAGVPKRKRLLSDALRRELVRKAADGGPNAAARIAASLVREAESGSYQHQRLCFDRLEGSSLLVQDEEGGESLPITINIVSGTVPK